MDALLQARRETEIELRQGLEDHAFTVHYQPIISLDFGAIVGFEALARWNHPSRGIVLPAEFIPIAEATGMIVQLGNEILREACQAASGWPERIRLAVNLSPIQFKGPNLVRNIIATLRESGLAPQRLDLEITESVLLAQNDGALGALHELRNAGIGICLDDFGTGYSSLSYLRSFPFDKIKIDRSFVHDMLQRADSGTIVKAVVELGRTLGMTTIAEGVETRAQFHRLRSHGCTEAQGFLLGRPRPNDEGLDRVRALEIPRRRRRVARTAISLSGVVLAGRLSTQRISEAHQHGRPRMRDNDDEFLFSSR